MSETTQQSTPQSSQPSSSLNAQIFTMPESYRHGKDAKLVEPTVTPSSTPISKPIPKPLVPIQTTVPKKSVVTTSKALLIAGVSILIALAIGGFLLVRSTQIANKPSVSQTVNTQPVPRSESVQTESKLVETPLMQPTEQSVSIQPGRDSDSDGLTDIEEQLIYGTNVNIPDSDSDGFLDGNEVFHRYNPNGTAPGTLLSAQLVQTYTKENGLTLLYPVLWKIESVPSAAVSFASTTGESILVTLPAQVSIIEWIGQHGGQEQIVKTKTKDGNEWYVTRDQMNAFVLVGTIPVLFTYQLGLNKSIEYVQTFQMMINSLRL